MTGKRGRHDGDGIVLATTLPAVPPEAFQTWIAIGRELLTQRSNVEWQLADWIKDGRDQFGHQAEFDFLADQLGIAPKALKSAAKVAKAFPPALRDQTLTFEHHQSAASLPVQEALVLLRDAKANRWDDRETRIEAVRRHIHLEDRTSLPDEDWEYHELIAITRAWNRARTSVRSEFMDLAAASNLGVIDA